MQHHMLVCLLNTVAVVTAVRINNSGYAVNLNTTVDQMGASVPKILGFNSSFFGSRLSPSRIGFNGHSDGPGLPPALQPATTLPQLPNVTHLIPKLLNAENSSSIYIPPIHSQSPSLYPPTPGLSDALQDAHNHLETALGVGMNFIDGIQMALEQAFQSDDPTTAVRTLVNTILNAYLTVAENCPMIIVGVRVLREGIRLVGEVAMSARNVILGPSM